MRDEISNLEFSVLLALAVMVSIAFLLIPLQGWTQALYGRDLILEILISVLIVVQVISLAFQVRNYED
ncbi:MAG: hypothetical protein ACLFQ8_03210 [Candidatus Aenigmatarchaeota archaeon]